MKAFVSYSMRDSDQYVLTLLATKLRQQNFFVSSSQNTYGNALDYVTINAIRTSNLFIGIITKNDPEAKRVIDEWRVAIRSRIPNILLIEDNVEMNQSFTGNYLRFNRFDPEPAINEINRRMSQSKNRGNKSDLEEAVPWLLGGVALLALIGALSKK